MQEGNAYRARRVGRLPVIEGRWQPPVVRGATGRGDGRLVPLVEGSGGQVRFEGVHIGGHEADAAEDQSEPERTRHSYEMQATSADEGVVDD